jgi:hypothetical protein
VPVEWEDVLPPPTCAVSVEREAVLSPPVVETGAVMLPPALGESTVTAGVAPTEPTCAVPVELVAVLPGSARAGVAVPSTAAHVPAARPRASRFISVSFSSRTGAVPPKRRNRGGAARHPRRGLVGPFEFEREHCRMRHAQERGGASAEPRPDHSKHGRGDGEQEKDESGPGVGRSTDKSRGGPVGRRGCGEPTVAHGG